MRNFNCKVMVAGIACLVPLAFASFAIVNGAGSKVNAGEGGDCYKLAAPLDDLMGFTDDVFYEMDKKVEGKKFKNLRREANFLAEMANLLLYVEEHRQNKQWLEFSGAMKTDSLKMAAAAKKKDGKRVMSLHAAVEKSCDSCHDKFRDN
jgi:hypothetical protein